MDPYLEAPDIWPDFHDAFASELRGILNDTLPAPYYARLEMRPEIGIVEQNVTPRRIVPDVAVVRHPGPALASGTAVLDEPRTTIAPYLEVQTSSETIRHAYVEIRDPAQGHRLVTLVEIVSPSNKQAGSDRDAYLRQQREVMESDASLIEVDLLRGGRRLLALPELERMLANHTPPPDYVVLLSRAWQRGGGSETVTLFPIALTDRLPCIPVPLRQDQPEVPLDLQYAFRRAYDSGPYRRGAVNYALAPRPALPPELLAWAQACLHAAGLC
jgi:hypothetical protein